MATRRGFANTVDQAKELKKPSAKNTLFSRSFFLLIRKRARAHRRGDALEPLPCTAHVRSRNQARIRVTFVWVRWAPKTATLEPAMRYVHVGTLKLRSTFQDPWPIFFSGTN